MIPSLVLSALLARPNGTRDLVQTAADAGGFETLLAAATRAELVDVLRSAEALTLLAPSDEAFAALPESTLDQLLRPENREALTSLLKSHVVAGRQSAGDLLGAGQVETLGGTTLRFALDEGRLLAGDARVLANDIEASNGVIHVIDRVLVPEGLSLAPPPTSPATLIELAIRRGVPLFNSGQHGACAALYELAARSLLLVGEDSLSDASRSALREALGSAKEQRHPAQQAWILREALDSVRGELQADTALAAATLAGSELRSIFEFGPGEGGWFSVNDDVMGGISRGGFEQVDDSVGAFRGALSLENNGGFSTIRSKARDLDLSDYEGLAMRVRGDGRTYAVRALMSDRRSEVRSFRAPFETEAGEWQEIRVPFSALELSVMGRRFSGNTIDPARIQSLGFSISDKNETPFRLEIDWVRAYR